MSTLLSAASSVDLQFASDIRAGLTAEGQKWIPSTYLYDEVGSALFDVITLLPEYGLTRADTRVIQRSAHELASCVLQARIVAELGSGSGRKTRHILEALGSVIYYPIDVSHSALQQCKRELEEAARVHPIEAPYLAGLKRVAARGRGRDPMLVLFLGSTIGNFGRQDAVQFLSAVRQLLCPGDALLLGVDLVKPVDEMLAAYDDSAHVTAAFNINLLARINRELGGNFDTRLFRHEARWNPTEGAIEMHLVSVANQDVEVTGANCRVHLRAGESIWTESSHKYHLNSLPELARESGFRPARQWVDTEWPFAENLWVV